MFGVMLIFKRKHYHTDNKQTSSEKRIKYSKVLWLDELGGRFYFAFSEMSEICYFFLEAE
jgi:hypothetical protein